LIIDYWIVRKRQLDLHDLYVTEGRYTYTGGWNWAAIAATALGCFAAWGGKVIPVMAPLVPYGWFIGFAVAAVAHQALMALMPPPVAAPEVVPPALDQQGA
jgi:NCS1 family nucleobase:cation symporter-1